MRRRLSDVQIVLRSLVGLACGLIGTAIAFLVPVVIGFVLCHFLCGPGPNDFNPYWMYGFFIGLILACLVAIVGLYHTLRPWAYPYTAIKPGHCRGCGYNLHGLQEKASACPGCGEPMTID